MKHSDTWAVWRLAKKTRRELNEYMNSLPHDADFFYLEDVEDVKDKIRQRTIDGKVLSD